MTATYIAWADGDPSSFVQLSSDLTSAQNDLWINSFYPYDGTSRILGRDIKIYINSPYLSATSYPVVWDEEVIDFKVYASNVNIGRFVDENDPDLDAPGVNIVIYTSYKYIDPDGKEKTRTGIGVTAYPYPGPYGLIIPKPTVTPQEPLAIHLSMEASSFIRDGIHSPNIVADVTWKGEIITSQFTKHNQDLNPTSYDYPFPNVTFEAGVCLRKNFELNGSVNPRAWDQRGSARGCFTVGDSPDVSLSVYVATVSLSRTSIYSAPDGISHTHACSIDVNGNGLTNETISLLGVAEDHTHSFANYISTTSLGHTHTPRSVAVVKLNPTSNPIVEISINSYVVYDPTSCDPYPLISANLLTKPTTFPEGNRMVFDTLYVLPTDIQNRELVLDIAVAPEGYTAEEVTETNRGINITATAGFTAYTAKDNSGNWISCIIWLVSPVNSHLCM